MCTVSIVALDGLSRMVANRDERRSRGAGLPPAVHKAGGPRAIFPMDPDGGGTWIGVNDAGLAVALLNRSQGFARATADGQVSRGEIARAVLLQTESLDEAIRHAFTLDPHRHLPYRLVLLQHRDIAVVIGGGGAAATLVRRQIRTTELFCSSSRGDQIVEGPRRQLFVECLRHHRSPLAAQHVFHRHSWPRRGAISVVMDRPDARTVSRTQIDLRGNEFTMEYEELAEPRADAAFDEVRAC